MYSDKRLFCSLEVLGIYASLLVNQINFAVKDVLLKNELSKGLNPLVFIVYSNGVGALVLTPFALFLEKRKRPRTVSLLLFGQFFLLSIGGVCLNQEFMLLGLKDTSPAFALAMPSLAPAIIFVMAWALGMEEVDITCLGSRYKIVGTLVGVCGATAMSFLRGPALSHLWLSRAHSISDPNTLHSVENILASFLHGGNGISGKQIRGCIYLVSEVTFLYTTVILQAVTVNKYPAPLSLASITVILGSIQTAVLITVLDRGIKPTSWVLDRSGILTIVYAGIACNGIALSLQLWCMQKRGPVFITIFNPVATVCSAILSSLFLGDTLHLGSVMGMLLIFAGLYLVLWGKSQDRVTHIKISSEKEEDLHTTEEEHHHHPSSSSHFFPLASEKEEDIHTAEEDDHHTSSSLKIPLVRSPLPISE